MGINSSYIYMRPRTRFGGSICEFCISINPRCHKGLLGTCGTFIEISFQKAAICCTAMHRGAALAAMSYLSGFLEVSLSSMIETVNCKSEGSFSVVSVQVVSHGGEGLLSNLVYALLGVAAMSRVHKCSTILMRENVMERNVVLGISPRMVWALPSEYLKQGEAKNIVREWSEALGGAGIDYLENKGCNLGSNNSLGGGPMQGKHRNDPNLNII